MGMIYKNATRDDRRWMEIFSNYQAVGVITDARIKTIADDYRYDLNVAQTEMEVHNLRYAPEGAQPRNHSKAPGPSIFCK